jgi:hypothetical protein
LLSLLKKGFPSKSFVKGNYYGRVFADIYKGQFRKNMFVLVVYYQDKDILFLVIDKEHENNLIRRAINSILFFFKKRKTVKIITDFMKRNFNQKTQNKDHGVWFWDPNNLAGKENLRYCQAIHEARKLIF